MRKLLFLLLAVCLVTICLFGCYSSGAPSDESETIENTTDGQSHIEPNPIFDVWDGSVADNFSGGSGTENDPYKISSASELAFLARSVNDGETYSGKYILLTGNLDLNDLEWTPVGNGVSAFRGNFDGNGFTIKNITISEGVQYVLTSDSGHRTPYCDAGLFASVNDASIQNLVLDGARIKVADPHGIETYSAGALCGCIRTDHCASEIRNIKIRNVRIIVDIPDQNRPNPLLIGGAIGYICCRNDAAVVISMIDVDSSVSFDTSCGSTNYVGTVIGGAGMFDSAFTLQDCSAGQTVSVSPEQYYYTLTKDYCGAIGNAQASSKPFCVMNVFSKTTLKKPVLHSAMNLPAAIVSNAIIGEAYYYAMKDDPTAVGYRFENVFGCVVHEDTETGEKTVITDLYELPAGPAYAQKNCQGCVSLPADHGFDAAIWDLSDPANPELK